MKFCAHELCPKGTMCHYTEELSTILPLALHSGRFLPSRWQYLINSQCPGTDPAPAHKGQEGRWQQRGCVT